MSLTLNESRSAAQSNFAPNALMMLVSITIASGPKCNTKASTGKDVLLILSAKRIYPKLLRGVPSALRNDIAPDEMGKLNYIVILHGCG